MMEPFIMLEMAMRGCENTFSSHKNANLVSVSFKAVVTISTSRSEDV
jgi:hypothetical protein